MSIILNKEQIQTSKLLSQKYSQTTIDCDVIVPDVCPDIKKILEVIISEEKNFTIEKFREKAAIMLSCKMAINANMNISMEEMEKLIDDLRKCGIRVELYD